MCEKSKSSCSRTYTAKVTEPVSLSLSSSVMILPELSGLVTGSVARLGDAGLGDACCGDGGAGRVVVEVTFASEGSVRSASVTGGDVPPPVRSCVARALRQAHVPPFTRASFRVTYPFML